MPINFEQVLDWASWSTGEGHTFGDEQFFEKYYWSLPVKTALFRLSQYSSYFIGLIGLVGTGKSSAIAALKTRLEEELKKKYGSLADEKVSEENEQRKAAGEKPLSMFENIAIREKYCNKVLLVKWKGDLWEMLREEIRFTSCLGKYHDLVYQNLKDAPKARKIIKKLEDEVKLLFSSRSLSDYEIQKSVLVRLAQNVNFGDAEKMLPQKVLDNIRALIAKEFLVENVHTLLIDMPDYSQKGSWKINKDLDGIGALWNTLKGYSRVNTLVCLQQELVLRQPHLIMGKMDKIILKTLTVEQLLEAYKQFFGTYEPFTEDALKQICKLSRGVFRRFKNYVRLCLEVASMEGVSEELITVDLVKRAITQDQLKMDMDLELSDFFKNSERKLQAFSILDFVRDNPDVSQKAISDTLGLHPNAIGDVVRQLCLHNYLKVKRGKGTELLVSLKE